MEKFLSINDLKITIYKPEEWFFFLKIADMCEAQILFFENKISLLQMLNDARKVQDKKLLNGMSVTEKLSAHARVHFLVRNIPSLAC